MRTRPETGGLEARAGGWLLGFRADVGNCRDRLRTCAWLALFPSSQRWGRVPGFRGDGFCLRELSPLGLPAFCLGCGNPGPGSSFFCPGICSEQPSNRSARGSWAQGAGRIQGPMVPARMPSPLSRRHCYPFYKRGPGLPRPMWLVGGAAGVGAQGLAGANGCLEDLGMTKHQGGRGEGISGSAPSRP